VREYNPGATAGVIPIAYGGTQQTAATNPKPELLALNGNNSAVVGTNYNVLTYQNADNDNLSVIQQRVDTLVISCSCKFGGAVTADDNTDFEGVIGQPYRPTYWDGTRYVDPTATTATSSTTGIDTSATQSPYCDICCRDHNDTDGDTVKFDPWDTSSSRYKKYEYVGNTLTEVVSGSHAFLNACRLIRVGGSYAVATDLNNYFFAMLATTSPASSSTTAKSPIPDTTDATDFGTGGAVAKYQAFVLNYLQTNISTLEANTIPSVSTTATTYGGTTYNLDIPATIAITYDASTTDYRYLHSRGIYVDYLEPAAVTAIGNAITNCTLTPTSDCFLPLLPFTTINLSEIASWSVLTNSTNCTSPTKAISVNNQAIINEDFNANRGVVTARSCAAANENSTVEAYIGNSNSGIAAIATGFAQPVDPQDNTDHQTDTQVFQKSGGASTGGSVAATITLTPTPNTSTGVLPYMYSGYQGSYYPSMSWQLDSVAAPTGSLTACTANSTKSGNNNPLTNYSCPAITTATVAPIAATITVQLKTYNFAYTDSNAANPCPGAASNSKSTAQHCVNYAINTSAIVVNGTTLASSNFGSSNPSYLNDGNVGNTSKGTTAESASITLPSVSANSTNTISIGFTQTADTVTTYTCSGKKATYATCD